MAVPPQSDIEEGFEALMLVIGGLAALIILAFYGGWELLSGWLR